MSRPLQLSRFLFAGFVIAAFSHDAVAQNTSPQIDCIITSSKRTRIEGGDYDDKLQKIAFDITMTNKSMSQATGPLQATFYAFGESVHDRKAFKLLQKETFDFELEPRGKFSHTTPQIELKYDTTGASFGEKYKGWVVQVADGDGTPVFEQKSSVFLNDVENLPNLKIGDYCDRSAQPIPTPKRR